MIQELHTEENAPWKKRYRTPSVTVSQIAASNPEKGILAHNRSGTLQWYAWDITTNELQQITNTLGGHTTFLTISPDSRWVYYLNDKQGNEIGHIVRIPYTGGPPEDITPELPDYSPAGFAISRSGNRLGFIAAYDNQLHLFCTDMKNDHGALQKIHTSQ